MSLPQREEIVAVNQKGWNQVAPIFYGGTALPRYGPLAQTEDELNLIPDLSGKSILELGCGSGHTLGYLRENRNASYLWALDLSEEQIRFTKEFLGAKNVPAKLFLSSWMKTLAFLKIISIWLYRFMPWDGLLIYAVRLGWYIPT